MQRFLSKYGIWLLWGAAAAIVFGLQSYNVGFWHPHHGFVSSHGLSLMAHATPDNGFVGYARAIVEPDGSVFYHYFDRYPFLYNAFGNLLMRITDNIPTELYIMRQWMNLIFVLTLFVSYRLVRQLLDNRYLALAVVLFAASSYHHLFYKDMIHYDQPAILLMFVLITAIARYEHGRLSKWGVFAVALVAVIIARGYVSFFALGLWFVLQAADGLQTPDLSWRTRFGRVLRQPSLWITVVAVIWASGWLLYNLQAEANIRGVSIAETSIVDSARRRLPMPGLDSDNNRVSDLGWQSWAQFSVVQTERLALWAVPGQLAGDMNWRFRPLIDPFTPNWWRAAGGVLVLAVGGWSVTRFPPPARKTALLLGFSGIVWIAFMFNLAAYHIYVTMYAFGLVVVGYAGLLRWASDSRWAVGGLVTLSLLTFALGNWQVRQTQTEMLQHSAPFTYDLDRAKDQIETPGQVIMTSLEYRRPFCIINNDMCFALGYYLSQHQLTETYDLADYVLSPRPFFTLERFAAPGETISLIRQSLTPQNEVVYLLNTNQAEPVRVPDATTPVSQYGNRIQLMEWTLRGDVTLSPCQSMTIQSWWRASAQPEQNLNMQVVMVDENGSKITDANAPLGAVPTSIWETNRLTTDIRPLTVPCDTPPGEYPLIMGVYEPDTLQPLPVTDAAGNALGNQMYLTTLFVE